MQQQPVRAGEPDCLLVDAPRAGATARLLTSGKVAIGMQGDGQLALRVERPDGSVYGETVYAPLDPNANRVLSIGPLDGPRDGGAVRIVFPQGTTRLCGLS